MDSGVKDSCCCCCRSCYFRDGSKINTRFKKKNNRFICIGSYIIMANRFYASGCYLIGRICRFLHYRQQTIQEEASTVSHFPLSRRFGYLCLALFFGLLILLPILREITSLNWIAFFDSFYRSGSLVFGGGHVVLPLLEQEFVPTGWLSEQEFLAGYGATQAVPGPLFTFAAYLGAVISGWQGGLLATIAIFLPAFLLILGTL